MFSVGHCLNFISPKLRSLAVPWQRGKIFIYLFIHSFIYSFVVVLGIELSARQALYHLSPAPSPCIFLRQGLAIVAQAEIQTCDPPVSFFSSTGVTGIYYT
jgi:hypothetical protein